MTTTVVREATLDDARAIAEVHVRTWQGAYRGIVDQAILDAMSVDERARRWRSWFGGDGESELKHVYVAEDERVIVGFVGAGSCRDADASPAVGEVHAIYVLPTSWNHRVGLSLMQTALEALRVVYSEAKLWVLEGNVRARRFFERGGWYADGTSQFLEGLGVDEVRYRIDLSGE